MAVAGGVFLVIATVLVVAALASNTKSVDVHLFGIDISGISVGAVFIGGMITTILAVLGLILFIAGMRRNRRKRVERKSLQKENRRLNTQPTSTLSDLQTPASPDSNGSSGDVPDFTKDPPDKR
ncbi:MAG: hypothetical protein ACR2F6_17780 [Mycobacteriales bacterium]